ncbi:hypothetical protein B0H15DRAFT_809931 [Mycena belliarum]|uniref:Uncharacterized protein n=1 Tax=Mycena belliarum TaxID=1033014 RepID=A0AAD6UJL0_9AGAR|nr:hypothetical protein B0H15DRAFT_809931 [Mycena belliae]
MALTGSTTRFIPPPYSPITRVLHPPSPTASVVVPALSSPAAWPTAGIVALVVLAMVLALFGTAYIVWICYRQRTQVPTLANVGLGDTRAAAMAQPPYPRTSTLKTWDSSEPFYMKCIVHPPELQLDKAPQLAEAPRIWRLLGRPNIAAEDPVSDYEKSKAEHQSV